MEFLNILDPIFFFNIFVLIFSIIIHEIAHGYTALFLGDNTAENAGRLTLNPIPHIDIFGSVLIPLALFFSSAPFLFGYAKPVPYNPRNLKDKKWGEAKVAAAGPISNIILAAIFFFFLVFFEKNKIGSESTSLILQFAVILNLFLAVLNLFPVPPLDGSIIFLDILKNFSLKNYFIVSRFFKRFFWQIFFIFLFLVLATNFLANIVFQIYHLFFNLFF